MTPRSRQGAAALRRRAADSTADMDDLIDRIGALDGVERTTTSIVLSTKFER